MPSFLKGTNFKDAIQKEGLALGWFEAQHNTALEQFRLHKNHMTFAEDLARLDTLEEIYKLRFGLGGFKYATEGKITSKSAWGE